MAGIILDSVDRLDRFARSFLGFSRIPDPVPVAVQADMLVSDALLLYGQQKGLPEWLTVRTDFTEGLPAVSADRDLMFQVLQNLILNAAEAMESMGQGVLVLATERDSLESDFVSIRIQDTGPGVALDMQGKIFEPNITTREAGTGLGLVNVKEIVRKHGGHVSLQSTPGQGACFTLMLPLAGEGMERV